MNLYSVTIILLSLQASKVQAEDNLAAIAKAITDLSKISKTAETSYQTATITHQDYEKLKSGNAAKPLGNVTLPSGESIEHFTGAQSPMVSGNQACCYRLMLNRTSSMV